MIRSQRRLPNIAFLFLLLASSVGLLSACRKAETPTASTVAAASPTPAVKPKLRVGYSALRISLPIFVAAQEKIFEHHGLDVELTRYDTAQPLMQALVEGKIDVAGYTALPITYAAMNRSNQQLYFATAMIEDQQHRISYLLRRAAPAGGKRITSIAGLKGKKIGILPTIAYRKWLEVILKENKVDPAKVVIQPIEPQLEGQALASGGVDALFTNDPVATAVIAGHKGELITNFVEVPRYFGEPFFFGSFNMRKAWADGHAAEAKQLVAAIDEAIGIVNADPQRAKHAMEPYLSEAFRAHVALYPDALYRPSAAVSEADFQRVADQCFSLQITPARVNIGGLVYGGTK